MVKVLSLFFLLSFCLSFSPMLSMFCNVSHLFLIFHHAALIYSLFIWYVIKKWRGKWEISGTFTMLRGTTAFSFFVVYNATRDLKSWTMQILNRVTTQCANRCILFLLNFGNDVSIFKYLRIWDVCLPIWSVIITFVWKLFFVFHFEYITFYLFLVIQLIKYIIIIIWKFLFSFLSFSSL